MEDSLPFHAGAGGCACMVRGGNVGQWTACVAPPRYAARWTAEYTRNTWRIFLCEQHRDQVDEARELTEADRTALALRRERWRAALRGERWIPPRPLS